MIVSAAEFRNRRWLLAETLKLITELHPVMDECLTLVESGVFDVDDILDEASIADKLAGLWKTAKEKGKDALDASQQKVLAWGKNISTFISNMVGALKKWMSEQFDLLKKKYKDVVDRRKSEIEDAYSKMNDDKRKLIVKEVGHLREILGHMSKWMFNGFTVSMASSAEQVANQDEGPNESFFRNLSSEVLLGVFESGEHGPTIPIFSDLAHSLHKVMPFKALHYMQDTWSHAAKNGLDRLSIAATKLANAPGPYEFTALAALVGIALEVAFKNVAVGALALIPYIGVIFSIIGYIALGVAVVGVVETLVKKEHDAQSQEKHV